MTSIKSGQIARQYEQQTHIKHMMRSAIVIARLTEYQVWPNRSAVRVADAQQTYSILAHIWTVPERQKLIQSQHGGIQGQHVIV